MIENLSFIRDGSRGGGGGGGGCAQVRCCVSHVHRPSTMMEAGVTVVGIFASLSSLA